MTVAQWVKTGLICQLCHSAIDGFEPGHQRLCARCKAPPIHQGRRRGPLVSDTAEPEADAPELEDLDADGLELADA